MNISELIKGIIVGVAKIIPGLSGAVLMISFNLYDRAIEAITNFFSHPKKNFLFLFNLGIGVVIGIVLFSKIIHFFITRYYLYTTSFFIGLIIGGMPVVCRNIEKRKSSLFIVVLSFLLMSFLSFQSIDYTYVLKNTYFDFFVFFLAGILEAVGTILPGISSTALLMLMGVYHHYILILSHVFNLGLLKDTLYFLIPFSLGMFLGIIGFALLIHYLFLSYRNQTFSFILGISFSTIFLLFLKLVPFVAGIGSFVFSIMLMGVGYFITNRL